MRLELALDGAKIVIESDDDTAMTVAFRDQTTEDTIAFNCAPVDVFELIDGIKSCMETPKKDKFVDGERVMSEQFGIGTVIAMEIEGWYGVAFDNQIGRLHNCVQGNMVWGKIGTKSNCYWVMPSEIVSVEKPKWNESDTFCARFRRRMEMR